MVKQYLRGMDLADFPYSFTVPERPKHARLKKDSDSGR